MAEKRKIIDCRWFPSDTKCILAISRKAEEIMNAATGRALRIPGEKDTFKFRKKIRKLSKDAKNKSDLS